MEETREMRWDKMLISNVIDGKTRSGLKENHLHHQYNPQTVNRHFTHIRTLSLKSLGCTVHGFLILGKYLASMFYLLFNNSVRHIPHNEELLSDINRNISKSYSAAKMAEMPQIWVMFLRGGECFPGSATAHTKHLCPYASLHTHTHTHTHTHRHTHTHTHTHTHALHQDRVWMYTLTHTHKPKGPTFVSLTGHWVSQ